MEPEYLAGLLCFPQVEGGMLFRWLAPLVHTVIYFGFYNVDEKMRMNPVLVALTFHRFTVIDRSSSGGSDDFDFYNFTTGTVQGYRLRGLHW